MIDKLEEHVIMGSRIGLGYIYCDYGDAVAQTVENIVGVLLLLLLGRLSEIPPGVLQLYQERLKNLHSA